MSVQRDALYALRDIARDAQEILQKIKSNPENNDKEKETLITAFMGIRDYAESEYISGALILEWYRNHQEAMEDLYY